MNKYYIALLWIMIFFESTVFAMDELIKCSDAATYVITFCDTQTKNALGRPHQGLIIFALIIILIEFFLVIHIL
ncbi:MAG TPA: hypothetical protein VLB80_02620 [Candidatus Babeliales bacterium]|nr:hypothetical protein [Candidatus Babeliales bacterium]